MDRLFWLDQTLGNNWSPDDDGCWYESAPDLKCFTELEKEKIQYQLKDHVRMNLLLRKPVRDDGLQRLLRLQLNRVRYLLEDQFYARLFRRVHRAFLAETEQIKRLEQIEFWCMQRLEILGRPEISKTISRAWDIRNRINHLNILSRILLNWDIDERLNDREQRVFLWLQRLLKGELLEHQKHLTNPPSFDVRNPKDDGCWHESCPELTKGLAELEKLLIKHLHTEQVPTCLLECSQSFPPSVHAWQERQMLGEPLFDLLHRNGERPDLTQTWLELQSLEHLEINPCIQRQMCMMKWHETLESCFRVRQLERKREVLEQKIAACSDKSNLGNDLRMWLFQTLGDDRFQSLERGLPWEVINVVMEWDWLQYTFLIETKDPVHLLQIKRLELLERLGLLCEQWLPVLARSKLSEITSRQRDICRRMSHLHRMVKRVEELMQLERSKPVPGCGQRLEPQLEREFTAPSLLNEREQHVCLRLRRLLERELLERQQVHQRKSLIRILHMKQCECLRMLLVIRYNAKLPVMASAKRCIIDRLEQRRFNKFLRMYYVRLHGEVGNLYSHHVVHMDTKPTNILLDAKSVSKIAGFGMSKLVMGGGHDTQVSKVRAVGMNGYELKLHVSPPWSNVFSFGRYYRNTRISADCGFCYEWMRKAKTSLNDLFACIKHNNFSVITPAKRVLCLVLVHVHVPKSWSADHQPPLMPQFAHKRVMDIFGFLKPKVPKSVFDIAKRLCSPASPNGAKLNYVKPWFESPNAGSDSEYNIRKDIARTENDSPHPRQPFLIPPARGIEEVVSNISDIWAVATAAPHHATGNRGLFSCFITNHDDLFVHALDGVPMKVLARGAVVTDAVVLPDVWFVPGLKANLVSVSQLAELDYSVGFGCGECCIRSAAGGSIVGKARLRKGGMYVLDFLKVPLAM